MNVHFVQVKKQCINYGRVKKYEVFWKKLPLISGSINFPVSGSIAIFSSGTGTKPRCIKNYVH